MNDMKVVWGSFFVLIVFMVVISFRHQKRLKKTRGSRVKRLKGATHIQKRCWIHVSGFHHSGTGVTRQLVLNSIDATELHTAEQLPSQNEGHWMQNVYPSFANRNPKTCTVERTGPASTQYTCPLMLLNYSRLDAQTRAEISDQLETEWEHHVVDPSNHIVVQKTPTFDMLYLDTVLENSAHVLVMRHPYHWHWGPRQRELKPWEFDPGCKNAWSCFEDWKKVWSQAFRDLRRVRKYIVVQYEGLPDKLVWNPCNTRGRRRGRRLHFRGTHINTTRTSTSVINIYHDKHWASITPAMRFRLQKWEGFMKTNFGYSLLNRKEAFTSVRCCRFASNEDPFLLDF